MLPNGRSLRHARFLARTAARTLRYGTTRGQAESMTEPLSGWKLAVTYGQLLAAIYGATPEQVKEYVDAHTMAPLHQTEQQAAAQAQLDELGEKVKALLDANDLDRGEPEEIAPPGQTTELVVEVEDPVTPLLARLAAAAQEKEPDDRGAQGAEDQRTGNAAQTERLESEKALAEIQGRQTQDLEEQLASINEQYTEGHQNDSLEEKAADAAKLEEAAQLARAELADRQAAEQERERAAREAAAPTAPTPDRGM
jgi:hypothetical protein